MIQGSPQLVKSATKAFRVDPIAWAPKVEIIQLIGIFCPQKRVETQFFHFQSGILNPLQIGPVNCGLSIQFE